MKKLDSFVLGMLHRIATWTYRRFSLDNYGLGVTFIVLAVVASISIGFASFHLAAADTIPKVAQMRKQSSLLAVVFFGGISVMAFIFRKDLRNTLQLKHDLGEAQSFQRALGLCTRWIPVGYALLAPLIGKWWGGFDLFLLGVGMMFLSCEPPDMNLRIQAWERSEKD